MELLEQYIEGLNQAIKAGSDVRTRINGKSVPVIHIEIAEETQNLLLVYLNRESPFDKSACVPLRSPFTMEFNDYPNELREAGWE
jgi:hypothetical protein